MTQPNRDDEASTSLPASLAARPHDIRRGLPIPPVNVHSDPVTGAPAVDFTNINTTISTDLAANRQCSLCGIEMGYWVAFLGGPRAAELMRYTDPPGCPDFISTLRGRSGSWREMDRPAGLTFADYRTSCNSSLRRAGWPELDRWASRGWSRAL
jgi:hypothetical protein